MQHNRPRFGLEDDVGYETPPFVRTLEESHNDIHPSHHYQAELVAGKNDLLHSIPTYLPTLREPKIYNYHNSDNMSDAPSTSTPRLSDISSVDSPRTSLDQTPTGPNAQGTNQGAKPPYGGNSGNQGAEETRVRRLSPESDAVTSSDDEVEQNKMLFAQNKNSAVSQFSSRRPSYAAEFQTRHRNFSVPGGGHLSPTTSNPATPSGDTAAWAAAVSSATTAGLGSGTGSNQPLSSFWGSMGGSIWNPEPSRKSPPKGLNVQVPPGTSQNPNPLLPGSDALPSPTSMPVSGSDFPFPIPPQPLYRNHRSMSFSVGQQIELEDHTRPRLSPPTMLGGPKPPSGLQHRPSRPSLLSGEQYPESTPLRRVSETEDDEEPSRSNDVPQTSNSMFSMQQQQSNYLRSKYDALRARNRSASTTTIPSMNLAASSGLGSSILGGRDGERIEEYESAIGEEDDMDFAQFQAEQRRFSEAPRSMSLMYSPGAENQRLETLRRQHWASSGSPLGLTDSGAQSRRHSFAGRLPMTELGEADYGLSGSDLLARRNVSPGEGSLGALGGRGNNYLSRASVSSFDTRKDSLYLNDEARLRVARHSIAISPGKPTGIGLPSSVLEQHVPQMPAYPSPSRLPHQPSPPPGTNRSMMAMQPHHVQQPRTQQLLYFVTFKACRGDVFYVQEGTGLRVRVGDLVIVEADRGTDLGTVVAEHVTWQKAKELKEQYAKEQYNVLMMFASRRNTAAGAPGGLHGGIGGSPAGFSNPGAGGPMGGHGQPQGQDSASAELKPKMIKRLAQPHEIQTLRDKEANEAKAKRVCQQKVLEHRLPMEILDAEFQMDWKKLTFYYFADSYINFNSLVTDLFKVYKTRIWMSAMNPASFAHPGGLHPPGSGIAPSNTLGAIGELPSDSLHSGYTGMNTPFSAYTTSAGPTNTMMGPPQRNLAQQNGQHLGLYHSQHSPHSSLSPQEFSSLTQQHNGFSPSYMNGASGISGQGSYTNGEGHGVNGVMDTWTGLQSLSLNSH